MLCTKIEKNIDGKLSEVLIDSVESLDEAFEDLDEHVIKLCKESFDVRVKAKKLMDVFG